MTVVVDGQPGAQTPTQVTLPVGRHTIIVRRRGNGDDGHHGGAWKIAFADFMTAMMALLSHTGRR